MIRRRVCANNPAPFDKKPSDRKEADLSSLYAKIYEKYLNYKEVKLVSKM
jgi:hypothetical protein